MNKEFSCQCEEKMKKLKNYKRKSYINKCRNELYLLMREDITIWIKSVLKKWGKHESREEIISLSWDCFEFCLKHYKINGNGNISQHFYKYISYYLLNRYASKESIHLPIDELKEVISYIKTPHNMAFDKMLTLMQFRECLPEKYLIVWDDAMQSMAKATQYQHRTRGKIGMNDSSYRAVKEVMKSIVKFILD